jgi:DNA-3-methyladenine glycosylase II
VIRRDANVLQSDHPRLAIDPGALVTIEVWGGGYAGLVRLILGQLVSIEAADAMWANLCGALGSVTPETIMAAEPDLLKKCGFTARKAEYARSIGEAVTEGLDFATLDALPDGELVKRLQDLRGVGRWTAECYLLFGLGRRDVFPAGDLALRIAWQEAAGLSEAPPEEDLRTAAEAWSPRRTAASYLLWSAYLKARGRA